MPGQSGNRALRNGLERGPAAGPPRSFGRWPRSRVLGFTLIELLVVMALISILMGVTVSTLSRVAQASKLDQAWRLVRDALGDARVAARERGALSRVVIVPGSPPRIEIRRGRDAGTWHLDEAQGSRVLGGRNNWAVLQGASLVDGGTVRGCASFDGGHVIVCENSPFYEPTLGFSLAMDVWPDEEMQGGALFAYGHTFQLDLGDDGSLSGTLDPEDGQQVVTLKTAPGVVARGRWARVELSYDGLEALIRAHGVIEARKTVVFEGSQQTGVRLLPPEPDQHLTFGSKAFRGLIDEVTYRTLEEPEVIDLEPEIEIGAAGPIEVRFDADGRLDPRVHEAMVVIPLACEGERREVTIDLAGVVR